MRFGLRLALRTGREALTRLLVTAGAVAVGVSLLLCVLATFHAYQSTIGRPCWECTRQAAAPASAATLLWSYRDDYYDGRKIERLDEATLAATTPVIPGLTRMPAPGTYYASPALAALLATIPADELGERFPGRLVGTIGDAGLDGPDELAIVVGYPEADLSAREDTLRVSAVNTRPRQFSVSQFYQFGFAMGTVALLVPMLILIGTATRLAAARREERYAALRLVGATRRQIGVISSIDAVLGGFCGVLLGILGYAVLRPLLTGVHVAGERFFTAELTPTAWAYPGVLIGVPLAAAVASVISLYRVGISPLGVSRRVTPPAPRAWRLVLLAIGLPTFCVPLLVDAQSLRHNPAPAMLALVLVIAGLVLAGPWLTMRAARLLARTARSGPGVLAARRLADNPRAAYRSVSGLVLAVMVGTALATIVPVAVGTQQTAQDSQLADVLRVGFAAQPACAGRCDVPVDKTPRGMPSTTAAGLLAQLSAIPGAHPIPVWADRAAGLISCTDLRQVPALGSCAPGASVQMDAGSLFTDNLAVLDKMLPLITSSTVTTTDTSVGRGLVTVLVVTDSADALERARTLLSRYTAPSDDPSAAPQTFGEVAAARSALYLEIQGAVTVVAGLTLLIAGCSLAVSFSGGIVERRRPFTLLRLAGTPVRALYRVVLLETVFPLVSATVLAVVVGFAVAIPVAWALAPKAHGLPVPSATYYLTLGSGMVLAVVVILACLPILRRITVTDSIRFE